MADIPDDLTARELARELGLFIGTMNGFAPHPTYIREDGIAVIAAARAETAEEWDRMVKAHGALVRKETAEACAAIVQRQLSGKIGGVTIDLHTMARTQRELDATRVANELMGGLLEFILEDIRAKYAIVPQGDENG